MIVFIKVNSNNFNSFNSLEINPKISNPEPYWQAYLNGYKRLATYSKIIGWSNPKNINKVIKWKRKYLKLGKEVMASVV